MLCLSYAENLIIKLQKNQLSMGELCKLLVLIYCRVKNSQISVAGIYIRNAKVANLQRVSTPTRDFYSRAHS